MPVRTWSSARAALAALTAAASAFALAGCGAQDSAPTAAGKQPGSRHSAHGGDGAGAGAPATTTEQDWKPVADALERPGTLMDRTVYRVPLPRKDLKVTSHEVEIKPGLSLSGYAAFAKYHDGTMLMGDLVVTEEELPKVTDALQKAGIEQTAVHKHLLEQSPAVWWTHIHGMGDPATLAKGVRAALAVTGIPAAAPAPSTQPPVDLDTAAIDAALGRKGTADGGIYRFIVARREPVTDGEHVLPPALGISTAIGFQPLGGRKAAINGDFVMTADEIQDVIRALRKGGIDIVELHHHSLDEQPRLFYMHFWATADGATLAKALRAAVDATHPARNT
ncbi:DUF1259 domain-containing protein [Streptomyces sp. UNOB3_S3]|uniref:DUF1259 domain-containing protein n=1 Tax=Streptomyces sp. UNOB3_S3 TaxID=2871682 RepID=UPI001E5307DB|nr:DUF1259 domain-containing protein [Streptomyces sp. UNOB3_S3]MCC3778353.1 DUF1259 domain-containing protein [Streptomyces sp. UNOB3_S3]